jgi:hypothetical protein
MSLPRNEIFTFLKPGFILLVTIFFLILASPLHSQYFSIGTDPASVKWKKIKTENYTVIFPRGIEDEAQYIANGFEYFIEQGSKSLQVLPPRFPVILHNKSVYSNAFVPYAPKRIEFLTTPPQDNDALNWIDGLILHEIRHTVQYSAVNTGFTKAMSFLFGQQAPPAVLGLFAPFWFIEGDAVSTETAMGHSGRGRVPSFEMKLRAQFLEKGIYNYDKATHGSYKDFTPDRYELGYQLVGRSRVEFGRDIWADALRKSGQLPFMVVPFSHSLKKQTGYGKVQLYRHITDSMMQEWVYRDTQTQLTVSDTLTPQARHYTNYTLPVVMEDGSVIAVRKSIDDITRIVQISNGREERLFTPGTGFQADALSASDKLICWSEIKPDPRWSLRDYAVVKTYDIETGKTRQITHRSRYFAPVINKQGDKIAAVEVSEQNQYKLVILDVEDGSLIKELHTDDNLFFMHPAWSFDGTTIACVVLGDRGKSLLVWNTKDNHYDVMLPFSYIEISRPTFYGNTLFYTGSYSGTDNIYSLSLISREVQQVTSARFGVTDAAVNAAGDTLVFANYTSDGYMISKMQLNQPFGQSVDISKNPDFPLAESLTEQEDFLYDREDVPDSIYPVKKYCKALNLFNFHSWAPLALDINNMEVNPGVTLLSQNLLGTSYTSFSYEYDLNEEAGKYSFDYSYEGFYPTLNLGVNYGLRRGAHRDDNDSVTNYKYHELNAYTGTAIPLSWNVKSWYMGVRPGASYSYKYLRMDPSSDLRFNYDRINALSYRLFSYAQQKSSYRDLQPRWGQLFELNFRHTLCDSTFTTNSLFSIAGVSYFPGFAKHHGFRLYLGYQQRNADYYYFSNLISTPRGQSGIYSDNMVSISASYVFPVFYPDWRLGPVLYFKRLKGAVFYDHSILMDESPYIDYNTIGLDLSVDFHFLSILAPLEIGLRSMYFPGTSTFGFQFLWGFNIDSLY